MGHRRFPPLNHPLRRKGKHFKGEPETRAKPIFQNGKRVFSMVKDVHVVFGKGRGSKQVLNDENGHAPMWKKKSILWDLPYWDVLEVRNTIVDFKKIGYKDEPFVLAKDVTQVFYVK